jgi:hypothetical protein
MFMSARRDRYATALSANHGANPSTSMNGIDTSWVTTTTSILPNRSASGGAASRPIPMNSEPMPNRAPIVASDAPYVSRKNTFMNGMKRPAPSDVTSIGMTRRPSRPGSARA